jgi:hypothetical protein
MKLKILYRVNPIESNQKHKKTKPKIKKRLKIRKLS